MATSTDRAHVLSKYVTLVSSDGFEFVVLREAACKSGAIRRMLDPKSKPLLVTLFPCRDGMDGLLTGWARIRQLL